MLERADRVQLVVRDRPAAAIRFTALSGLDPRRFSSIGSERFGCVGVLARLLGPAKTVARRARRGPGA